MGRGELAVARDHLDEARRLGEGMRELQRLSPALWGLAEVALADDDPATAVDLIERGAAASAAVDDAAYLYPFAVTGTRAYLALGDPGRAREWIERVADPIERRGIPGTLASLDHGRGLLAAADGSTGSARTHLVAATAGWRDRRRAWEGAWAQLDLARCHLRSNQRAEAVRMAARARDAALALPAPAIVRGAEAIIGRRRSAADADGVGAAERPGVRGRAARRPGTDEPPDRLRTGDQPQDRSPRMSSTSSTSSGPTAGPRSRPGSAHGPCYTPALTARTVRSSVGTAPSERGMVRAARDDRRERRSRAVTADAR